MTLEFLFTILKFAILIFGSGLAMKLILLRDQKFDLMYQLTFCCAIGMTFMAISGYFLSMFGIFNASIAQACFIILSAFVLISSLQWLKQQRTASPPSTTTRFALLLDIILLTLLSPTLLLAAITPITDGDGLYSFNTWAMHWALRDNMNDYFFLAYGQLLPIVASWIYKISLPWQGGIPSEQYVLHAFYVIVVIFSLLMIRRIPSNFTTHWIGSLIGFGCATLLFLQQDIFATLVTGKAEPITFLFEALIILELVKRHEADRHDSRTPYRLGMLIAGLVFIKPSVVPLGTFFILALYLLEIKINLRNTVTRKNSSSSPYNFLYSALRRSLFAPLISSIIVISLIGPFYAMQYRLVGNAGYSHPANMSPGGGNLLGAGIGATGELRNTFAIRGQTSSDLQLFTYRITEVFMIDADRGKKLWEGIHAKQIALFILIAIGFILSLRLVWLWPLHLAAVVHTSLWYIFASFAYYDLTPGMILYVALSGIGFVKLFEAARRKTTKSSTVLC